MTGAADGAPPPAAHASAARRRSAGIYSTIVASAVLAAGGGQLATVPLAVTVLVTLLVYWAAEGYAELLGEAHAGHLPTWAQVRASLATIWPMVSASYVPLLSLLVARVLARTPRRLPRWRWWSPSCCCWSRLGGRQGLPVARPAAAGGDADRGCLRRGDDPAQAAHHPLTGKRVGVR